MQLKDLKEHFIAARLAANPNKLTQEQLNLKLKEAYPQESEAIIRRVSYYLDKGLKSDFELFLKEVKRLDKTLDGRNVLEPRDKEEINFEKLY